MTIEPKHTPSAAAPKQGEAYVDPSILMEGDTEKLQTELAETRDKLLRSMAELENQRRRTERDLKDTATYAIAKFATDMLGIADNLRRALEASPPEIKSDKIAAPLLEGVEITERALQQTLERYNVKPIDAIGEKFDPHLHQAMFELESTDAEPGTVIQEMQKGYTIGDRILRPAFVGVAKAPAN